MWRRLYILLGSGLVVLPILLLWPHSEPVYQGRSLSDWVVAMHQGKRPEREKARAVVHYLGPQSIPWLLQWLQQPDRLSLKAKLSRAWLRVLNWLERRKLLTPRPRPVVVDEKQSYRFLAVDAFRELGPEGKTALPGLIRLLSARDCVSTEVSDTAAFAYVVLRQMAPTSIPALVDALSSPDDQVWALAAQALADIGPEAREAIPLLRRRLTDRDPMIRLEAADAMGRLGVGPEEFMPVVVHTLRERGMENLDEELEMLLKYKDQAQSALPILGELLARVPHSGDSENQAVRCKLTNALAQLRPQAPPVQQVR